MLGAAADGDVQLNAEIDLRVRIREPAKCSEQSEMQACLLLSVRSITTSATSHMPTISVPKQEIPVLQKLTEISEQQLSDLLAALDSSEPRLTRSAFVKAVAPKVPSIAPEDVNSLVGTVCSLHWTRYSEEISVEGIVDAIVSSLSKADAEAPFEPAKLQLLKSRLTVLLNLEDSIGVTAKALDVMTEHANIFCKSRILSDIRPIFSKDGDGATAAVIIHTLNIGYHENRQHKEFYVALDESDLKALREVLDRAEKKALVLRALIGKSGTRCLNAE